MSAIGRCLSVAQILWLAFPECQAAASPAETDLAVP